MAKSPPNRSGHSLSKRGLRIRVKKDGTWDDIPIKGSQGNSGWTVVALGDFNGDGILDLAWRRSDNSGEVRLWLYNKNGGWNDIGLPQGDKGWYVVGAGDFNRDKKAELVWRRTNNNGEVRIWFFDSDGRLIKDTGLPTNTDENGWRVVGVEDSNGDGISNLILHRNATDPFRIKACNYFP